MKKALLFALALAVIPVGVDAQVRNPLTGLSTTGHVTDVQWNDRITEVREQSFTQEVERAFELGLLRTGITLDEGVGDGDNYLLCHAHLYVHPVNENLVMAYTQVSYRELVTIGGAVQFVTTWQAARLGGVGIDNLSAFATDTGEWCAEEFELAWRRANN